MNHDGGLNIDEAPSKESIIFCCCFKARVVLRDVSLLPEDVSDGEERERGRMMIARLH